MMERRRLRRGGAELEDEVTKSERDARAGCDWVIGGVVYCSLACVVQNCGQANADRYAEPMKPADFERRGGVPEFGSACPVCGDLYSAI